MCAVQSSRQAHPALPPSHTRPQKPQLAAVRTSGEAPTTNGCSFDAHHALHSIMPEGDEFNALHIAAVTLLGSGAGAERPADKVGHCGAQAARRRTQT